MAGTQTPSAVIVFNELTTLVGDRQGYDTREKHSYSVNYHLTANGSALVETWTVSPGREALTIYTLDGSRLLATHYCPRGNQPRLVFAGQDSGGNFRFQFVDGTNLQDPNGIHQHAFRIRETPTERRGRSEEERYEHSSRAYLEMSPKPGAR